MAIESHENGASAPLQLPDQVPLKKDWEMLQIPEVDAERFEIDQENALDELCMEAADFLRRYRDTVPGLQDVPTEVFNHMAEGIATLYQNAYNNGVQVGINVREEIEGNLRKQWELIQETEAKEPVYVSLDQGMLFTDKDLNLPMPVPTHEQTSTQIARKKQRQEQLAKRAVSNA